MSDCSTRLSHLNSDDPMGILVEYLVSRFGKSVEQEISKDVEYLRLTKQKLTQEVFQNLRKRCRQILASQKGSQKTNSLRSSSSSNISCVSSRLSTSASAITLPSSAGTSTLLAAEIPKPVLGKKLPVDQWDVFNYKMRRNMSDAYLERVKQQKNSETYKQYLDLQLRENELKKQAERDEKELENKEMEYRLRMQQIRDDFDKYKAHQGYLAMIENAENCKREAEYQKALALKKKKEQDRLALLAKQAELNELEKTRQVETYYQQKRMAETRRMMESAQERRRREKEHNAMQDKISMETQIRMREEADARREAELKARKDRIEQLANTIGKSLEESLVEKQRREDEILARDQRIAEIKQLLREKMQDERRKQLYDELHESIRLQNEARATERAAEKERDRKQIEIFNQELEAYRAEQRREEQLKRQKQRQLGATLKKQIFESYSSKWSNKLSKSEKEMNQDSIRYMIQAGMAQPEEVRDLLIPEAERRRRLAARLKLLKPRPPIDLTMEGFPYQAAIAKEFDVYKPGPKSMYAFIKH